MATASELIYDVLELVRGNQISDDTNIDDRQILYHYNIQRALWIRNELNKPGRSVDPNIIQDLGCVELEETDPVDCCTVSSDCVLLRSKLQIPTTIELHDRPALERVGPPSKVKIPFNFMPIERIPYVSYGKYSQKNLTVSFLLNNYIYVISPLAIQMMLDYVNVRGVFEDPTAAAEFNHCNGDPCYSNDDEYPLNAWMIPYIKEQVLKQFGVAMQIPKDNSNDAQESLVK